MILFHVSRFLRIIYIFIEPIYYRCQTTVLFRKQQHNLIASVDELRHLLRLQGCLLD